MLKPVTDGGELLGASMIEEIRRSAERRLREIEPLVEEAERLRDVLDVLERRTVRGLRDTHSGSGVASGSVPRPEPLASGRAAKGANKRVILELVARRPGITPAEISRLTGMKRTVVASTVSRLKRQGDLRDHARGGICICGQQADAVPASAPAGDKLARVQ